MEGEESEGLSGPVPLLPAAAKTALGRTVGQKKHTNKTKKLVRKKTTTTTKNCHI